MSSPRDEKEPTNIRSAWKFEQMEYNSPDSSTIMDDESPPILEPQVMPTTSSATTMTNETVKMKRCHWRKDPNWIPRELRKPSSPKKRGRPSKLYSPVRIVVEKKKLQLYQLPQDFWEVVRPVRLEARARSCPTLSSHLSPSYQLAPQSHQYGPDWRHPYYWDDSFIPPAPYQSNSGWPCHSSNSKTSPHVLPQPHQPNYEPDWGHPHYSSLNVANQPATSLSSHPDAFGHPYREVSYLNNGNFQTLHGYHRGPETHDYSYQSPTHKHPENADLVAGSSSGQSSSAQRMLAKYGPDVCSWD